MLLDYCEEWRLVVEGPRFSIPIPLILQYALFASFAPSFAGQFRTFLAIWQPDVDAPTGLNRKAQPTALN